MKVIKIKIDQYLEDILEEIPSNTIIYKTLTGIGATTFMLKQKKHHVIIIVPNVPVIKGKCKKFNKRRKTIVKGVYEKVTVDSITDYLNSSTPLKKFITTPESFYKIKEAIEEHPDFFLYNDFFLLFDECERLVQDAAFRERMLLPMDDFFEFNKKALISATPIELSDPRFEREEFKKIAIKPSFSYKKDLRLIETNNIEFSLAKFIEDNPREHYFIFHNTTDSIAHLIKRLKMEDESAVFCANDSMERLKGNDFKNIYKDLAPFKKFNFFTSRFFSAVDIDFPKDPTIIMLTDLHFADHSTIDPLSEAVQIVGRFRDLEDFKPQKEIVHITNLNPDTLIHSEEHILEDIKRGIEIHKFLKRHLLGATTRSAVKCLNDLLKRLETTLAITPDSRINHYLKDNKLFEEKVKSYYLSAEALITAYSKSRHFNVWHQKEEYTFSDKERIKLLNESSLKIKTIYEVLMPLLAELSKLKLIDPHKAEMERLALKERFPKQINELEEIGLDEAERLRFNVFAIREAINKKRFNHEVSNFEFIDYLHNHFRIGEVYTSKEMKAILRNGIRKFKLFKLEPKKELLERYFKIPSDRRQAGKDENGKYQKGFLIEKRRLT